MTLEQAIVNLGTEILQNDTNDWYQWRDINPAKLPSGVELPAGNQYVQNIALKMQLCELYANADDKLKHELTNYYIVIWGGIKGNLPEKINSYALDSPAKLIANGSKGIASWSKALCIRNPNEYAIYDARVAVSLNSIQEKSHIHNPQLFPLLSSQNTLIKLGNKLLEKHAKNNHCAASSLKCNA